MPYKRCTQLFIFILPVLALLTLTGTLQSAAVQAAPPDGLSAADWAQIQSQLAPLAATANSQQAYLKASNTGANDFFGCSVAVDSDTVVVGAYREASNATGVNGTQSDNSAPNAGAAYVFVRSGNTWSQQAYLKASNTAANDNFGYSVDVAGDTVVVGAYGEASNAAGVNGDQTNNLASFSGAAYVFTRSGTTWSQQAYLKASNTGIYDYFGTSVAAAGDTVVVGAYGETSNATGVNGDQSDNSAGGSGAAYVFTRNGSTWNQQAYLKASNTDADDYFGASVAVFDDTVVVGASGEASNAIGVNGDQSDNSAGGSGAAYVFTRSGTIWSQQAYLKASNTEASDHFGFGAAIDDDTMVVGAYGEASNATGVNADQANNSASNSGAAYIFTRSGTTWSQQAYLKASNTDAFDFFGYNVAVADDTVVVGTFYEDSSATGVNGDQANNLANASGAAYIFIRSGNTWSQQAYLKASNTDAFDNFGSVAVVGDTVVVGAYVEASDAIGVNGTQSSNSASGAGAAYVFTISPCIASAGSGNWSSNAIWVGGVVPGSSDSVCISTGNTVTLDTNAAVYNLTTKAGATLNLDTYNLTVEGSMVSDGTLQQTQTVNNAAVEFLHIQNAAATVTKYRAVQLDSTANSQNLGDTTVSLRELNSGEYCTTDGAASPVYATRCYDITPTSQPGAAVALRLYARTAEELNGIAPASLQLYHWNSSWQAQTSTTGSNGGIYSYAQADVTAFSPYLLGGPGSPTAVTLQTFSARSTGGAAVPLILLALLIGLGWVVWRKRA